MSSMLGVLSTMVEKLVRVTVMQQGMSCIL